jgi:hypothetical protein
VAVKRGTLLSGQTKEWGFAEELPVDLLGESWVMDALIFSPWFATPRSLLAADGVVVFLKKKGKMGVGVVSELSKLPWPFVDGGLAIGVIRHSRHEKLYAWCV